MSDEGERPGRAPARRAGLLDPTPLIEESELPLAPPARRRTAIAETTEDDATSEGSDATHLSIEESFSTFSTDGGSASELSMATQSENLEAPGATMSTTNLVLGALVRDYLLHGKLGDGTFAEVFRAEHVPTGRVVALKVLRHALTFDESLRRRVLREGEMLQNLRHPNLVEVYEVGLLEDGRAFVAMEILSGRTLRELLTAEAPLAPDRAFRLTEQVASGLEVAHRAGIVHRDLKPANIFVVGRPPLETVKLLDFGLARIVDRGESTQLTRAGDLIGSPGFMAPEQIRDPANADPRADLYALGVTAYAMVMGRLPFVGRTHDVLRAQLNATPAPLPALGGFERVVEALMSKDPEDRPASASILLERLHGVSDPTFIPTSAPSATWPRMVSTTPMPTTPVPRVPRPVSRRPRDRSVVLAAILMGVAALLVYGLYQMGSPPPRGSHPDAPASSEPPAPRVSVSPSVEEPPEGAEPAPARPPVERAAVDAAPGEQKTTPELPPAAGRRTARSTKTRESIDRKNELVRVRPELLRALRSRGLRLEDAALLVPNEPDRTSASLPREALSALLDRVHEAPISEALLRARLKRLFGALEALAGTETPPSSLPALEARYFKVRETLAGVSDSPSALESLNRQIDEIENDLDRVAR